MSNWTRVDQQLPPEGEVVNTLSENGQVATLVFASNLWWFPDRSMYVYYRPEFWQALA